VTVRLLGMELGIFGAGQDVPVVLADEELGEQRRVADALQDRVHVARVAQVLQARQRSSLQNSIIPLAMFSANLT